MPETPCEAALPTCSSLPHPSFNLFVYRCTHRGAWVAWMTTGDVSDPVCLVPLIFGPFASLGDVYEELSSRLHARLLTILETPAPSAG
jgi:hypothetical protein